ncbi:hypothetical protein [Ramlibacter pallidus]|uniref:Uncharacterized protein n=1 Tax=Ramlibacter pallidus TaxID=2780087 RepID=A0ABR9S5B2_9BURK|nr:hypothetical protein [Ramlibacter pallidus]MBE7368690.1 hypothetical protein [Ramlibacter pallidus]
MSLSSIYFGTSSPTTVRRIAVHASYVGLGLVGYSFWTDFAPSALWYRDGSILAAIFTVVVFGLGLLANAKGHRFYNEDVSEIKKGLALVVLPAILFGLTLHGVLFGVGALFTKLAGTDAAIEVRASKWYSASRRSCDYYFTPELASPFSVNVCMTPKQFGQFPSGATVRLLGSESRLGFHIREWQPVNDTQRQGAAKRVGDRTPCGDLPLCAAHLQR